MTSCIPLNAIKLQAIMAHPGMQPFAVDDVKWSEALHAPTRADDVAGEAIFVICNSGMKNTVARRIYDKVMAALKKRQSARTVFGHEGKAAAIDHIWKNRTQLFAQFIVLKTDDERLVWCASLPWVGEITKYHLAKNLGVDCAKPDVHLQRIANLHGETVDALCRRLAAEIRWRVSTVDLIIWRACAEGVINSRTGEVT